jgi:adenosylcobinamide-phosphate synthase
MSAVGAVVGAAADALLGEPPARWHPVAHFGTAMERVEGITYGDGRARGVVHLGVAVAVAAAGGVVLRRAIGRGPAAAVAVAVCSAGRMLDREALAVVALLPATAADIGRSGPDDDLDLGDDGAGLGAARERLRRLVGRDTSALDAAEISRAVIESVAENGVDAVAATVWWAAVGGAPAALAHRAINTLDAMVGHRDPRYERFGWASARADDIVNHAPARLTALAVAAVRPRRAGAVWRTVRRDAGRHPSPNGGVVEAAFAAALDVQLGGINRYGDRVEDRGTLGDGRPPVPADVAAAVRLRRDATAALCAAMVLIGAAARRATR